MSSFRFDQTVIEQRKTNILNFLYYCAENPPLNPAYRSSAFAKFFEVGLGSPKSPKEQMKAFVETDDIGDVASSLASSLNNSIELEDEPESQSAVVDNGNSFEPLDLGFDYLYDAAMCFSQAVQEEANLRYKSSFELYKVGIDKLLTGAKNDTNEKRKRIAKTKAEKYLERAEQLYENYIVHQQDEILIFEQSTIHHETPSVLDLERPANNLSRFKVISVCDYRMTVQDCTDKKFYFLKSMFKDKNCTISLPQSIPYHTRLVSYYKTENSIFLLLPLISGGLLWDYINNYSNESGRETSLDELFVDPPEAAVQQNSCSNSRFEIPDDDPKFELAEEITEDLINAVDALDNETAVIRSFDTLSSEMDISDLMSCSQLLLQSVSKTLEKSQVQAVEKKLKDESDEPLIESEPEEAQPEIIREVSPEVDKPISIKIVKLPETVLKQWSCELIVCVNNLHKSGIICGDLNLDNLMLGSQGHLMLTYFYQTTRNEHQQLCRLNPKALKCMYAAFEFPLTEDSDWYSVGVLIYEIMTQDRFYLNHNGGISRYNEIQYSDPDVLSIELKELLHGLIIEKADKRFKYDDLIAHPFFRGIDWHEVQKRGPDMCSV